MSRRFVAFVAFALIGAASALPVTAVAAGGMRAGPAGGFRGPLFTSHRPRAIFHAPTRARLQPAYASQPIRPFRPHAVRAGAVPPSPHDHATTSPLRPFARLERRHHRIHHSGWIFPAATYGHGGAGYIGTAYDPAETIPVYAPLPENAVEPALPPDMWPGAAAAAVRSANEIGDRDNVCRAEHVTVPARNGQREITVVRC